MLATRVLCWSCYMCWYLRNLGKLLVLRHATLVLYLGGGHVSDSEAFRRATLLGIETPH